MRNIFLYITLFFGFSLMSSEATMLVGVPELVDFGRVLINSAPVTKKATFTNTLGRIMSFKSDTLLQTMDSLFVINTKLPFRIAISQYSNAEFTFNPGKGKFGIFYGTVYFFNSEKPEDSAKVILRAEIYQQEILKEFEISLPNIASATGSNILISMILGKYTYDQRITGFEATVEFNSTLLTMTNPEERGNIEFGRQIVKISKKLTDTHPSIGDTLYVLNATTLLGNARQTPLTLKDFKWTGEVANAEFRVNKLSGSVLLQDIYFDNGIPRLLTRMDNTLKIESSNNVFNSDFELQCSYVNSAQFKIIDVLGNQIVDLSAKCPLHNLFSTEKITIPRSTFTNRGIYIAVLSGPKQVVSKLLIIE